MNVVTRFAPSPTGFLHIGGCRTALFNWLFAKANNGIYRLRIEDTDAKRSTQAAKDAILQGLEWLNINHDGPVIWQSEHLERHQSLVESLIEQGKAYRCYATQEDLVAMREQAKQKGLPMRYDRRWRERDPSTAPKGASYSVRIKMPYDGQTTINDLVQGTVQVDNATLDDFILLRADGSPTYMLSVVVDDHDMNVTHIIRGDDHLNNAFRQLHLFKALGFEIPEFAHIPLIHAHDGTKLSKRHGALGIESWREAGFLPEAMVNYLLRLGWGYADEEIIAIEKVISIFKLSDVGRSPAKFDLVKLTHFNGHYLRQLDNENLICLIQEHANIALTDVQYKRLQRGMDGLKARAKTLVELTTIAQIYLVRPDYPFKDVKAQALVEGNNHVLLSDLVNLLEDVTNWNIASIEHEVREWCASKQLKLGAIAQPLRAAITGSTISPSIFEIIDILGYQETLTRIKNIIDADIKE